MAKKPELTPDEKYALKYMKELQKKGKPGQVQERLDRFSAQDKAIFASAIRKTKSASRAAEVNKPAKQAKPDAIKVRSITTKKLSTFDPKPKPRGGRGGMGGGGLFGGGAIRKSK